MRKHNLSDTDAVLDFLLPLDIRKAIAMRRFPRRCSNGEDET
ncbi:hypothetical protein [Granulicella sp. S156]|nr:hypothetical protein [Granulicella sp. S156]